MKRIFPKSKLLVANLVILFIIVGGILLVESGPEPWYDSENVFDARLHNSLGSIDEAKNLWAEEKSKAESAVPTFDDLAPYLGDWKKGIEKLQALGIVYTITSTETNQSDIATLTRGIRFRAAFCAYYPPGTTVGIRSGWRTPPVFPITLRMRLTWLHAEFFLVAALFVLVLSDVIIWVVRQATKSSPSPETPNALTTTTASDPSTAAGVRAKDLYVLIFGCLFCLLGLGFVSVTSLPGDYLIENMGNGVGVFITGATLLLPVLCRRFLKIKPAAGSNRFVVRSGFLISLLPATIVIWSFLSAWSGPLPYHARVSDTKRITKGMTEAQVRQALGQPRGSSGSGGKGKERMRYDLQIPWGRSGQEFFVDLIDDKVVNARIVRYGGDVNDDFFMSDFVKDLMAGAALPGKEDVEQACLVVCRKEHPGTVRVEVLDMAPCLMGEGLARVTGSVIESSGSNGASNSVTEPFTIVLAKGPAGWHPTEYDLRGVKGILQQDGATKTSEPSSSETNRTSSP